MAFYKLVVPGFIELSLSAVNLFPVRYRFQGHPEKFALIYDSPVLEYASRNPPCTTRMLSETLRPVGYGLMFRKHSPYTPVFDNAILELRESGDLETLTRKWVNGPCPNPGRQS